MDAKLKELVKNEEPYFTQEADGRIKCILNGHCFPARFDVISAFVNGSKYKNLKRKSELNDFKKWEPFIVDSKNRAGYLFCALTCRLIERDMAALKRHLDGGRFKRAKERYLAAEDGELMLEPTLEGSDGAMDQGDDAEDAEGGVWVPEGILDELEDKEGDAEEEGEGKEAAEDEDDEEEDEEDEDGMGDSDEEPEPAPQAKKGRNAKQQQTKQAAAAAPKAKAPAKGKKAAPAAKAPKEAPAAATGGKRKAADQGKAVGKKPAAKKARGGKN